LAGATMLPHLQKFELFEDVGAHFFTLVPVFMQEGQRYLARAIIAAGALYVIGYVAAYARLASRGYRISFPQVFLLASTGLCSIWVWGYNPWGQAFFIMNVFHAVQYLALIWWSENATLRRHLRLHRARLGKPIAAAILFGLVFAYGYWTERVQD